MVQLAAFGNDDPVRLPRSVSNLPRVGWGSSVAHYTSDYETVSGLPVAHRRKVYARSFSVVTPIPILSVQVRPLEIKLD